MTKLEITRIEFEYFGCGGKWYVIHFYVDGKLDFKGVHRERDLYGRYEGYVHPKKLQKLLAHIEQQRFDDLNYERWINGIDCEDATITVYRGNWSKTARVVIGLEPPELRTITRLILWLFAQSIFTKIDE